MSIRRLLLLLTLPALVSCSSRTIVSDHPILLFNGAGTSVNDVKAIETILENGNLGYARIDSCQLCSLTTAELLQYRLLIVPGGNYVEIGESLSPETVAKVHNAVEQGLNYLGICAGAILAGHVDDRSLNLTSGVKFDFYDDVKRNVHKNVVAIETAKGETLDQYWQDGPQLNGWGKVVSKYPDGTAGTAQGTFGKGWVVLCGFHPEAPGNWRSDMKFTTPVASSNAYALTIIKSALYGREMPSY